MNPERNKVRDLALPLSREAARSLAPGDLVTVSGLVFTGRSRFYLRAAEQGLLPPIDFAAVNCLFHAGPVMRRRKNGWEVVSIEPTSSIRFERFGPEIVRRLKLRTLIGKTTMGPGTAAALREVGGIHLSKVGLCGNRLRGQIVRVREAHFVEELGNTEATWVLEVRRMGPFFVDLDARARSYFQALDAAAGRALPRIRRQLGIPADFEYTRVDPADSAGSRCP